MARRWLICTLVLCGVVLSGGALALQELRREKLAESPPDVDAPVSVSVAEVATERSPETRSLVGWVEPKVKSTIASTSRGVVATRSVADGQVVEVGDVLFRLDDREIRARIARSKALLARDTARHAQSHINLERIRILASRDTASSLQVEQAELERDLCAADITVRKAELAIEEVVLDQTVIRAPIGGYVGSVAVEVGSVVDAAEALLTITALNPVTVSFPLADRDFALLRQPMSDGGWLAQVTIFDHPRGRVIATAPVTSMSEAIDPQTGTIRAFVDIPNEDLLLWPGQYVRLVAELGPKRELLSIPVAALVGKSDGQPYVFVARGDGVAEVRQITVHAREQDRIVVSEGLKQGERVVVEGQFAVADGDRLSIQHNSLRVAKAAAAQQEQR